MANEKVIYRGRVFPVLKKTKTSVFIESFGTSREIALEEVVWEAGEVPVRETEIQTAKPEAAMISKPPEGKELLPIDHPRVTNEIIEPKQTQVLKAGTYKTEVSVLYPDGSGKTTYRVIFDIYGEGLEELNIKKIDDVDTGGSNVDISQVNEPEILKAVNDNIKKGEVVEIPQPTPEEIEEKKKPRFPQIGINTSIWNSNTERHNQNVEVVQDGIAEFSESIKKIFN